MQDIIEEFLSAMDRAGLSPATKSEIKADNQRHDYQIAGDAKGKRKGFYKLKIDGDFGYGFFGDYRQGDDFISWHREKKGQRYTPEQKEASRLRRVAEEKAAQEEKESLWNLRAEESENLIIFLDPAPADHPYLTRKSTKPHIALISGNDLIIPMGDDSRAIWSYQAIKPDGTKLFCGGAKNSKVFGCWSTIPGDDVVCIAEGYATACSIHEATRHTVIIAWSSGNLVRIAPTIRTKYGPDTKIIICADNDIHKLNPKTNEPFQTGLKEGRKAAQSINALLAYPVFTDNNDKGTDFNDLHQSEGLDRAKEQVNGACAIEGAGGGIIPKKVDLHNPASEPLEDWQDFLQLDKKGNVLSKSVTNLLVIMQHAPELAGVFKYDSFAKRIIVHNCPPWEDDQKFEVRNLSDYDYIRLESYLETSHGLKTSKDKISDVIISTAQLPCNTFNPASEYFDSLVWDGVPRLNTWLYDMVSDHKQDQAYLKIVGRKFLCGMAARAMHPGIKFDTMIILEGAQYAGKSFLSKMLATINGVSYFLDDFKDIENKDTLMKMQGKLIVEFAEISTMRKAEHNDLKAFLSRTTDSFRPPYGRNPIEPGRQAVFIGTTNPEGYYLKDVTGNRRYWPISCRRRFEIERLRDVIPQLHAEASYLVKNGEQLWLDETEYAIAKIEQDKRVSPDIWMDKISDIIQGKKQIASDEVMQELGITTDKRNSQAYSRITQTMISLGWEPNRILIGKKRVRGFKMTDEEALNTHQQEDLIPWE